MVHTVFKTLIRDKVDPKKKKKHSQRSLVLFGQHCSRKKDAESKVCSWTLFTCLLQNSSEGKRAPWLGSSQQHFHLWYKFSEVITLLLIVLKYLTSLRREEAFQITVGKDAVHHGGKAWQQGLHVKCLPQNHMFEDSVPLLIAIFGKLQKLWEMETSWNRWILGWGLRFVTWSHFLSQVCFLLCWDVSRFLPPQIPSVSRM